MPPDNNSTAVSAIATIAHVLHLFGGDRAATARTATAAWFPDAPDQDHWHRLARRMFPELLLAVAQQLPDLRHLAPPELMKARDAASAEVLAQPLEVLYAGTEPSRTLSAQELASGHTTLLALLDKEWRLFLARTGTVFVATPPVTFPRFDA